MFSESVIFQDFELATKNNVEGRLWDAHTKLNGRYRKALSRVCFRRPWMEDLADIRTVPRRRRKEEAGGEEEAQETLS